MDHTIVGFFLENFGLVMFGVALACIMVQGVANKQLSMGEIYYRWIALFPLGITALYAFVMHAFFSGFTATQIGWANSPFQFEVAVANLGFGLMAILSFRASFGFRLATVIGNTCWLWGDAIGHAYQIITHDNHTAGNAGSWFWLDIVIPGILIATLFALRNNHKLHS